jgi:hypothetical protein
MRSDADQAAEMGVKGAYIKAATNAFAPPSTSFLNQFAASNSMMQFSGAPSIFTSMVWLFPSRLRQMECLRAWNQEVFIGAAGLDLEPFLTEPGFHVLGKLREILLLAREDLLRHGESPLRSQVG